MAILKVKDDNGNIIEIPAIQGKSAYDYAKDGGYAGTEEEFTEMLGSVSAKSYVKAQLTSQYTCTTTEQALNLMHHACEGDTFEIVNGKINVLKDCTVAIMGCAYLYEGYTEGDIVSLYVRVSGAGGGADISRATVRLPYANPYHFLNTHTIHKLSAGDVISLAIKNQNGARGNVMNGWNSTYLAIADLSSVETNGNGVITSASSMELEYFTDKCEISSGIQLDVAYKMGNICMLNGVLLNEAINSVGWMSEKSLYITSPYMPLNRVRVILGGVATYADANKEIHLDYRENGTIYGYLPEAFNNQIGFTIIYFTEDAGSISNASGIPIASKEQLGIVKVGDGIDVNAEGVISISNPQIYSKDETVCGTWIDGKTLYRKVIEFGVTEVNKYTWLPRSSYGLSSCKIVKLEGIAHTGTYTRPIVHAYRSDEATSIAETIAVFADMEGIVLVNNGIAPGTVYLTVEYVKP